MRITVKTFHSAKGYFNHYRILRRQITNGMTPILK